MQSNHSVYNLIGLCQKSGGLVSGETQTENAVRAGQAKAVLVCQGASPNTHKKFINAAAHKQIPIFFLEAERLGAAIGKPTRRVAALIGGLSPRIIELLSVQEKVQ